LGHVLEASSWKNWGADGALEEDYPTTLLDEDGEELDTLNRTQMRELKVLQEEWKAKNRICYGAIMDVCYKNSNTKRIAKRIQN
jgi:hypothetical protein